MATPTPVSAPAATDGIVKEARFVLTNITANNNKFWNIRLFADGACETHWGRVGEDGQRKRFAVATETLFDARCREKQSKGYRLQRTLNNTAPDTVTARAGETLARLAGAQIRTNTPETSALVAHLARVNVHRILEQTTLRYDETRGTFSTPLGVVTADALAEARALLDTIGGFVLAQDWNADGFLPVLNAYLMLIPQNLGRARPDPQTLFPDREAIQKQSGLLDALQASLEMVLRAPEDDAPRPVADPQLFEARLDLVSDPRAIARIRRKYRATQQARHACAHLDVRRMFRVEIAPMRRAFDQHGRRVGNIRELWHGTRAGNLLSILKSGFVIPPASAPYCTGRMFGNGVYFSDQSTKSLNYAHGYWSGTRENTCYMFLCDVALGKSHTPRNWIEALPRAGSDSTFARAGKSGVANNEMIVYTTEQINPTFLIEFGPAGK